MVIQFNEKYYFLFEATNEKVPLRKMYKTPNKLYSASGHISEKTFLWHSKGNDAASIDVFHLRETVLNVWEIAAKNGLTGITFELTAYPINVGMLRQNIIFWQILKKNNSIDLYLY